MTNTNKKSKNTRKLLGAIGMLSVSAAMLVSSTFAWFSLNRNVRAQTMTVSAKSADPYLQISANGTDFYTELNSATATASNGVGPWTVAEAEKLRLIAPKTIGSDMEWVWSSSTLSSDAQGATISAENTGADKKFKTVTLDAASLNAYRSGVRTGKVSGDNIGERTDNFLLQQTLSFKNVSPSAVGKNLKIDGVTLKKNGTAIGENDFESSVRVLVVNAAGKYALYDSTGTLLATPENGATGTAMTTNTAGKAIIIDELGIASPGNTTDITIYMYFDGNAARAFTDNALNLTAVTAEFAFSIDSESATNP